MLAGHDAGCVVAASVSQNKRTCSHGISTREAAKRPARAALLFTLYLAQWHREYNTVTRSRYVPQQRKCSPARRFVDHHLLWTRMSIRQRSKNRSSTTDQQNTNRWEVTPRWRRAFSNLMVLVVVCHVLPTNLLLVNAKFGI